MFSIEGYNKYGNNTHMSTWPVRGYESILEQIMKINFNKITRVVIINLKILHKLYAIYLYIILFDEYLLKNKLWHAFKIQELYFYGNIWCFPYLVKYDSLGTCIEKAHMA